MRCEEINKLRQSLCSPLITIIGRDGAGIPVTKIEAIVEYDNEAAKKIFHNGLDNNRVIKTLLDETKIKSLIILDSGEIHPSTFHYITLKKRCEPYITLVTSVGCDAGGINIDKINLIINYKMNKSDSIVEGLLKNCRIEFMYDNIERTKSLILMESKTVYPCTFNFKTVKSRIHVIRGDEIVEDEE